MSQPGAIRTHRKELLAVRVRPEWIAGGVEDHCTGRAIRVELLDSHLAPGCGEGTAADVRVWRATKLARIVKSKLTSKTIVDASPSR